MSHFDLEESRMRNLEDNRAMLAKLNFDIYGPKKPKRKFLIRPTPPPPREYMPRKAKTKLSSITYLGDQRGFRKRSSVSPDSRSSSSSVSSNSSSARKMVVNLGFSRNLHDSSNHSDNNFTMDDEEYDSDTSGPLESQRVSNPRFTKRLFDDITDLDVEMVAASSSEKHYDKLNGTTCHQCRQKTFDQKTICWAEDCFGVRGQFCGPCLKVRYGEDAKSALRDPNWTCPPCRGICNCSFCLKKRGQGCTGIMIHTARQQGYDDVNAFLQSRK